MRRAQSLCSLGLESRSGDRSSVIIPKITNNFQRVNAMNDEYRDHGSIWWGKGQESLI